MLTRYVIRRNEYHDSVFLMRVARRLSQQPGVEQAAALMATEKNKALLAQIGITGPDLDAARPNDLVIAIRADHPRTLDDLLENIGGWLQAGVQSGGKRSIRTLEEAIAQNPKANLAVISVPGAYAAREAQKSLKGGLHVFLFSDNVPIEEEISLKQYAGDHGLIVMGPDCGTAIIGGIGIGFANAVRRGPIGVIGTSGTGMQEFTSLVHRGGAGISQAIGTGSRDLSDAVGGLSFLRALDSLEKDPETKLIAILSKPPGPKTLLRMIPRIRQCPKPMTACFLGIKAKVPLEGVGVYLTRTLDEAADKVLGLLGRPPSLALAIKSAELQSLAQREVKEMKPGQRYIRGIFAGGTFCYQAQQILQEGGVFAYSNAPLEGNHFLSDAARGLEHCLVDMGADEFTVGRPHPMIDPTLRRERLLAEAEDPEVAVILLDIILGYNASADPAGELTSAIRAAKEKVRRKGGYLSVVASVCGTDDDPQGLREQTQKLEETGAWVFPSSAQAAQFSVLLIHGRKETNHGR